MPEKTKTPETTETKAERPIFSAIEEMGRSRAANIGDEFNESDFLAGAMAALQAIGHPERCPGWWTIGVMSGRPVLFDRDSHARRVKAQEDRRNAADQLRRMRPLLSRCLDHLGRGVLWEAGARGLTQRIRELLDEPEPEDEG